MKLTNEIKATIRGAVSGVWEMPLRGGAEPAHILHQIEGYIIGLLELPPEMRATFYQEEK
jgi:hypothetical protein